MTDVVIVEEEEVVGTAAQRRNIDYGIHQFLAMHEANVRRARHDSDTHRSKSFYCEQLDTYLRKTLKTGYGSIMRNILHLCDAVVAGGEQWQEGYEWHDEGYVPKGLEMSLKMAIADVFAFYYHRQPNHARTYYDPFANHERAPNSLKQYDTVICKLANELEFDGAEPFQLLQVHDAEQIIAAVCKCWPQPRTQDIVIRHLYVIADMHGYYEQQNKLHRAWTVAEKEPIKETVARSLNTEQLEQVKQLSKHLYDKAIYLVELAIAERIEHNETNPNASELLVELWPTVQDYLAVAGLYGAPGERYECTRRDFSKACFEPDSDVEVRVSMGRGVQIHYKKLNKTGQQLTVDLSVMAPTLALFCARYKALLALYPDSNGHLLFLIKPTEKLFTPVTSGQYSYILRKLWKRYKEFLGFDMEEVAGTGCNAARHSHKRAKRGPPLSEQDKQDLEQQGHAISTDANY